LNLYSSRSSASRSISETRRTCAPTTRAASYIDGATANPFPASKSRRSSVMIDCVRESEPLVNTTNTRSPGWTNVFILRTVFTWS
jgi:hypothetical protein